MPPDWNCLYRDGKYAFHKTRSKHLSKTILFADTANSSTGNPTVEYYNSGSKSINLRHGTSRKTNLAFRDGHCRTVETNNFMNMGILYPRRTYYNPPRYYNISQVSVGIPSGNEMPLQDIQTSSYITK
jgi:hypothetical protein